MVAVTGYYLFLFGLCQMCHKHGVMAMHRDLKAKNFLFANKKETVSVLLFYIFTPGERFTEIVGSPYYLAPEINGAAVDENYILIMWCYMFLTFVLLKQLSFKTEPGNLTICSANINQ
ncbi:unnamed protein product [Urochloa humidicola]